MTAADEFPDIQLEWLLLVGTEVEPSEWLLLACKEDWPEFDASEFVPIGIPEALNT